MFKSLRRTLEELAQAASVTVQYSSDEKDYFDKECPKERCLFHFKLKAHDWERLKSEPRMTCPMCGHGAPPNHWFTTDQIEQAKAKALGSIQVRMGQAMRKDAQEFNQRSSRGFVRMSMKVKINEPAAGLDVPIDAAEAMELEIVCEACSTGFAVVGSAFFCPGCGHNSAERMFTDALRKIEVKADHAHIVRDAIERESGKDAGAIAARSLLESCLQDGVGAFQKYCEATYSKLSPTKPPFNAFQRLHDGNELWRAAVGSGHSDWIDAAALRKLSIMFQRRHLLAHGEGLVDAKYLANTSDTEYAIGQRIVVSEADAKEMAITLRALAEKISLAASAPLVSRP